MNYVFLAIGLLFGFLIGVMFCNKVFDIQREKIERLECELKNMRLAISTLPLGKQMLNAIDTIKN